MRKRRKKSHGGLQERIRLGLADPISDREREQLEEIRQVYIRRFGKEHP